MHKFIFIWTLALMPLIIMSCTSRTERKTNKAINNILNKFKAVGISTTVVKDGIIAHR